MDKHIWVKEAFGERWVFFAIWLQWIQNVIWFPTVLSFIAGTIAYVFEPRLADNKIYMVVVILFTYWAGALANFRGMKTSGSISSICVIGGVFFPGILIIVLGIVWLTGGNVSHITFSVQTLFPDLSDVDHIVFLAGAFLIFPEWKSQRSTPVRSGIKNETFPGPSFYPPGSLFWS